jgi:hypothetical protein
MGRVVNSKLSNAMNVPDGPIDQSNQLVKVLTLGNRNLYREQRTFCPEESRARDAALMRKASATGQFGHRGLGHRIG